MDIADLQISRQLMNQTRFFCETPKPIPESIRPHSLTPVGTNKYGVPIDQWATFTRKQKQGYYRRFRRQQIRKDPARYKAYRADFNARRQQCRKNHLDAYLMKERKRYNENKEYFRESSRNSYWRHREKKLERYRRTQAAARAKRMITLSPELVYRMIDKAIPKAIPHFVRDDVISSMCLAVLEGQLFVENIEKEATNFLKDHNRMFDTFKTLSLDAPIAGTDLRRIDLLIAE
ncbi:MAG: hypothetical protein J0H60_19955 [Rhizobiales bacterium]|nr:hypothetical protein [Hyphomicrobiales bacterium]